MFRSILASITIYSIVLLSIGQTASAIPQANSVNNNPAEDKSCASCSLPTVANPLDHLATLGRQTQNIELLPVVRSQSKGFPIEYVSSSTGEISFAETDLAFKDNPLLLFQRTYLSSRNEDVGLGRGWSFAFNDRIALNNDNAVLTNSVGDNFTYQRAETKHYVLQTSDSTDIKEFNVENINTISATNGDTTKVYKRIGEGDYYLSQITSPAGVEVTITRNSNGKMRSISSINGEISLDWSNGNNAKLLSVSDNTGRRISFGQSNGLLHNATTPTGGEWQYEYASGKISNVINPANRTVLRAKYDSGGRISEVGDAVGINRLTYQTNANNISTRTTFTDSLNYARMFQHTDRGILTNVRDAEGTLLSIQYDENSQPTQLTGANGATETFEYDAQKRLMRQVAADSNEKVFEYATNGKLKAIIENGARTEITYGIDGNLAESKRQRNGKNVRSIFNRRGQRVRQEVENGLAINSEYDAKGRETAYIYSDIGRFEKTFDNAGRQTSERMPSGFTRNFEYDANNKLVRQSDNRGRSGRVERDASGNLAKIINSNTDWLQILRDEAGRIVQLSNSRGQSRRYVYNSRGALIRFIGADGRDLQFQYNERGEMQSVINTQTANLIYRRNRSGNLAKIQKQSPSQKNFWQVQKINFVSAFTNSTTGEFCAFDDDFYMSSGEGWMDSWGSSGGTFALAVSVDSGDCYDPFAENGGGGETCEQCRSRQHRICQSGVGKDIGSGTTAGVALITCLAGGALAVVCVVVGGLFIAAGTAIYAYNNYNVCEDQIIEKCTVCNQ